MRIDGEIHDLARIPDLDDIELMLAEAGFSGTRVWPCPLEKAFAVLPQSYLERNYRDGYSTFLLLTPEEIEEGCERIRADIRAGRAEEITARYDQTAEKIGRVSFITSVKG